MTYSSGEAGAEGPKAADLFLLLEKGGGSFFIKDGRQVPAQLYPGEPSQPGLEAIPLKNELRTERPVYQALARFRSKDASAANETVLGISNRVKDSDERSHLPSTGNSPSKKAAVLLELKCASLESCLERAGL